MRPRIKRVCAECVSPSVESCRVFGSAGPRERLQANDLVKSVRVFPRGVVVYYVVVLWRCMELSIYRQLDWFVLCHCTGSAAVPPPPTYQAHITPAHTLVDRLINFNTHRWINFVQFYATPTMCKADYMFKRLLNRICFNLMQRYDYNFIIKICKPTKFYYILVIKVKWF